MVTDDTGTVEEEIQTFMGETINVINYMGDIMNKNQILLYNLMDELNLLNKLECHSCKEEVLIPMLKNIPRAESCPNCQESMLGEGEQTNFEDWDNGVGADESE
jgi:hypothetical protein|tara:strand:+ start:407 stop:718 length:312 start_codon:yes stop_codon:yes gene_type:complete